MSAETEDGFVRPKIQRRLVINPHLLLPPGWQNGSYTTKREGGNIIALVVFFADCSKREEEGGNGGLFLFVVVLYSKLGVRKS